MEQRFHICDCRLLPRPSHHVWAASDDDTGGLEILPDAIPIYIFYWKNVWSFSNHMCFPTSTLPPATPVLEKALLDSSPLRTELDIPEVYIPTTDYFCDVTKANKTFMGILFTR